MHVLIYTIRTYTAEYNWQSYLESSSAYVCLNLIHLHTLPATGSPPIDVTVTEVDSSSFAITWMGPTNNCESALSYEISSNCEGSFCSVTSSTSGFCSGWTAGQACSVMVRANSDLCGGLNGSFSDAVSLTLEGWYKSWMLT